MKRLRRRTRNRIISASCTLAVLALGVFIITAISKAGNDSEFDRFVGDAAEFGIVAQDSMQEVFTHSASNFATKEYLHGPSTSTGYDKAAENRILVGKIAQNARFSLNQPDSTVVFSTEAMRGKVASGENNGAAVRFEAETYEDICNQIDEYIKYTKAYSSSVVGKNSDGALLGFYAPDSNMPTEPKEVKKPDVKSEPKQPKRIDEISAELATMTDEDIKNYTGSSEYLQKVAASVSGGSVDADFTKLVEEYFKEWENYDRAMEEYRKDLADHKDELEAYSKYLEEKEKYESALKKWKKKNDSTNTLFELMKKHNVGLLGDGSTKEINMGNDLKKFVIVDVLDVQGDVAYVDMDQFFDSGIDDYLTQYTKDAIPIRIYKRRNQTVVFNASNSTTSNVSGNTKNEKFIPPFYIVDENGATYMGGNGYDVDEAVAKSIIWNFTSSDMILVKSDTIRSTIIAPNSDVRLGCERVCGHGWIICKSFWSNSEWYFPGKPPKRTPPKSEPPKTTTPVTETSTPTASIPVTETSTPTPSIPVTETSTPTPSIPVTETPTPTPTETPTTTTTPTPTPPTVTNTPAPTETPIVFLEEDVPKGPSEPEEEVEVPEEDVPLADFSAPTKPKKKTTTVVEEDVPLASTIPETGDTMNPLLILIGMGCSLLGIIGIVFARKKKLI
ncbi:MAG: collagen-binding domain-containing protein [Eubacterium sp.]|nr:collagen-binding domain-containing protein [Eubacterium sp.]